MKFTCRICEKEFEAKRSNAKYCNSPECKKARLRKRFNKWYDDKGKDVRAEQWVRDNTIRPVTLDEAYQNLALAVLKQAVVEQDYDWVSEFGREFCRFAGHQLNNEQYRVFILEVYREHAQEK